MILFVKPLKHFWHNTLKSLTGFTLSPEQALAPNAIAIAVAAFERGKDIELGALSLSQEGINLEATIIPWRALRTVRVTEKEMVLVKQFGNHFESYRIKRSKIQHLPIVLELISIGQENSYPAAGISHSK